MALHHKLRDRRFVGRLILALQRAISDKFTETDWQEIGYETGEHDYIDGHARLLRSLHFGDDDYGGCVFHVLKHFAEAKPDALQVLIDNKKVRGVLERDAPEILAELGINESGHVPTVRARSLSASEVVERALEDAENLLKTSGPISCVDRLHTALHGYLRTLCTDAGLIGVEGVPITALFKRLREVHPSFQYLGPQDKDVVRILNGFSSVIDAINTIRNNASVADPNDALLGEPEAVLAINVIRTIFHYTSTKVRG